MNTVVRRATRGLAIGLLAAGSAWAQDSATPSPLEQRLHAEVQTVLLRLVESGEIGADQLESLSLEAAASEQADLGAILDVRHREGAGTGLRVLGVTPGSSAAALGLQPGDRLLAVNEVGLVGLGAGPDGRALAAQRLREALLDSADDVTLRVARGTDEVTLRGPVRVVALPAYRLQLGTALANVSLAAGGAGDGESTCGRISVFDVAPRSQHLYRAVLIAVDGKLPGPASADTYRLSPGTHRLTVAEAIDARQFDSVQRVQRDRLRKDRYKHIDIEVQPGITYRLAARYHLEERHSIRDGAYWEPVIWKETPERCQ